MIHDKGLLGIGLSCTKNTGLHYLKFIHSNITLNLRPFLLGWIIWQ